MQIFHLFLERKLYKLDCPISGLPKSETESVKTDLHLRNIFSLAICFRVWKQSADGCGSPLPPLWWLWSYEGNILDSDTNQIKIIYFKKRSKNYWMKENIKLVVNIP